MRLDGRVAVITGGGSGIGAASALAMAREGARVVVVDVNEAGAKATVEQVEKAVFDRIMAVNVKGVWLGAKYALAVMKKARRGVFLITASTAAIRPRPGVQAYAASKGAVVTLTKSLALEAASHGVRVVSIAPVATETPMLPTFLGKRVVDEEGRARYVATVPRGRLNQPEDLARTAVFLVSDDAAMITGTCVEVDGGRCI